MNLINLTTLALQTGVSANTLRKWLAAKIIEAEICEGKTLRFDLDRVKAKLAKRAKSTPLSRARHL